MRLSIFASGSGGNCALLHCGAQRFLLDAGISARAIRNALAECALTVSELDGILITHEHSDHVSGLPVLLKHDPLPVYAPGTVAAHLSWSYPGVDPFLRRVTPEDAFSVGEARLCCFPTPHDTEQSVGWRVEAQGAVFVLATDTGHVTDTMRRWFAGADMALIEANHDIDMLLSGPYPPTLKRRILSPNGHLSNADCAAFAAALAAQGTKKLVLGHLSRQNNCPEKVREAVTPALERAACEWYIAPEKGRLDVEVLPCFA